MNKMWPLITRTIYENRKKLLFYVLIIALLIWMCVALYPSIRGEAEKMSEFIANYPEALLKAFGIEAGSLFLHLESFLAMENFSLIWPLILIVLIIGLGSATIAGEIEQGTIEVLLAQPVSRVKIYLAKYTSGALLILLFVFLSNFSVVPFALLHGVEYNLQSYFSISALGLLFGLAIFSLTMMLSALFSAKGRVASVVSGILISMYALNLAASLRESVENLRYLSFFHYYDYNAALIHNQIDPLNILVFLAVGVLCSLVGLVAFVKRDIAT